MKDRLIIIGYSGHAYVCIENALINGWKISGYCDTSEKSLNPFNLQYLGNEQDYLSQNKDVFSFIGIGDNFLREKIYTNIPSTFINLIHSKSIVSPTVTFKDNQNILINAGVVVNAFARIGKGVILNTSSIIEHECVIGDFTHIAPGAVLAGNVTVDERTFIGANVVIKQGIHIGKNAIIGAGAVVIRDVLDNEIVAGNPSKVINAKN